MLDAGDTRANPRRHAQVQSYRDLAVWQRAMNVAVDCYRATPRFPKHETYGLTAQLHRAAVSVAANIAEGRSRQHTREFLYHLSVAYGSLAELETHIEIALRLAYLPSEEAHRLLSDCAQIGRMINGLLTSLHRREPQ
ncbi:MAG: four helix bundle protein [Acidobacteriaceae bacterium]|nr:four helix bundle protein [Acidobacteriaceae bacterium]